MTTARLTLLCALSWVATAITTLARPGESGHAEVQILPATALPGDPLLTRVGQLPDGRMIFSTRHELLLHDGHFTETIPFPREQVVFEVHGQPDGSILVAAATLMARLRPDGAGGWSWEELHGAIPRTNRVWEVDYRLHALSDNLAAIGSRGNYATFAGWRNPDGRWTKWPQPPDAAPRRFAASASAIYELVDSTQLQRWTGTEWQPDRLLSSPIAGELVHIAEIGNDRLQLVNRAGSLFTVAADGAVHHVALGGSARPVTWVVQARSLPHGGLVVADNESRLLIFRADGSLIGEVAASSGLPAASVNDVFVAQDGHVWIVAAGQAAFISLPGHLTRFDRYNGLSAPAVRSIARHAGRLHVGTDAGIYRLASGGDTRSGAARFNRIPGPDAQVTMLLSHADQLLAGSSEGVFALRGDRFELIAGSPAHITGLSASPTEPTLVYAASHVGIAALNLTGRDWSITRPIESGWTSSFLETGEREWWASTMNGELLHYRDRVLPDLDPAPGPMAADLVPLGIRLLGRNVLLQQFKQPTGRPGRQPDWRIQNWGTTPLAVEPRGLWSLGDPPRPAVLLDPDTRAAINELHRLRVFAPTNADRAWAVLGPAADATGVGWQLREIVRGASQPRRILPGFGQTLGEIHAVLYENDADGEVLWIGGDQGLLRLQLAGLPARSSPRALQLHAIGALAEVLPDGELSAGHPEAGFRFAAPDSGIGRNLTFRTRLTAGGNGEWTPFTAAATREFSQLPRGDYRFEVQARNSDAILSPITQTRFAVAAPWWFSPWAAVLAIAAIAAVIVGGVRWSARRSRAREQRLEHLVAARTLDLRAREEQLSIAKTQAEIANRAKSTFLAAMSHELRTPLNAILGFAQILRRQEGLSAKGHGQIEVIDRNGQHLLQMINEVLDLSKIEADKMTLNNAPCSLRRLASGLAETFEQRASEKGLTFRLELGPGVPQRVMADEAKLRQILINLLANAVKFTHHGEVVLSLAMAGGNVRFEVRDTGSGIAPEERTAVFEPFHQAQAHRAENDNDDATGTGLGLPISQRLVGLMGGRIEVESELGQGSRFHFSVSLAPAANPAESEPATQIVGYEGPRRRVLVVDDVATNRTVLREMLRPLDFTVVEARTGAEALATHAADPVDLVLLDLHLPDIPGTDVAAQLAATPTRPRLVAVSASVYAADGNLVRRAGCDAFVPKPVHEATLFAAIAGQLRLQWITTPIAAHPLVPPSSSSRPPRNLLQLALPGTAELERWLDLARRANLRKLGEQIDAARAAGPDAEFRRALHELVQQFRTGTIREILTAALKRQSST